MDGVVRHLVGEHDFSSFAGAAGGTVTPRRCRRRWRRPGRRPRHRRNLTGIRWSAWSLGSPPRWDGEGGPGCDTRHHPEPGPVGGSPGGSTTGSPSGRSGIGSGPMSDRRPEAVLFDAGGTLVVIAATLSERLVPLGVDAPQQDRVTAAHYWARPCPAIGSPPGRTSAGNGGLAVSRLVRYRFHRGSIDAVDEGRWLWHHPLPGAVDAVRRLASRGVRAGSSPTPTDGRRGVGYSRLRRFVRDGCGLSPSGVSKPDPRIFAIALQRLGVPAASTWYVGDSPHHDRKASAAGLAQIVLVDLLGLHQPRVGDDRVGSYQPRVGVVESVADLLGPPACRWRLALGGTLIYHDRARRPASSPARDPRVSP